MKCADVAKVDVAFAATDAATSSSMAHAAFLLGTGRFLRPFIQIGGQRHSCQSDLGTPSVLQQDLHAPAASGKSIYATPGKFTFVVPTCALFITIKIWGSGGDGMIARGFG